VNIFDQQIGRDDSLFPEVIDNGCIITHTYKRRRILYFDVRGQMFDQPKLPKG
jgi:hypothetical protein